MVAHLNGRYKKNKPIFCIGRHNPADTNNGLLVSVDKIIIIGIVSINNGSQVLW
jgi:hypothetical protein